MSIYFYKSIFQKRSFGDQVVPKNDIVVQKELFRCIISMKYFQSRYRFFGNFHMPTCFTTSQVTKEAVIDCNEFKLKNFLFLVHNFNANCFILKPVHSMASTLLCMPRFLFCQYSHKSKTPHLTRIH